MKIFANVHAGLILVWRAGLFSVVLWSLALTITAAWMASFFSARQQAVVALDVGLSVIRLVLPVALVLVVQELLSREFDRRNYLITMAYPRSRQLFVFERFLTVSVLIWSLLMILSVGLAALVTFLKLEGGVGWKYVVTIVFISVDILVLAVVSCLIAVVAKTPSFVLVGTFGFMLVARSFSGVLGLLSEGGALVGDPESYSSGIGVLGYFVPDLGALDVRMIALYGEWRFMPVRWALLCFSSLAFVGAVYALTVWAINRKRFS